MTNTTFYPTTNLFPHHPQILHQMVIQLFLLTDRFEEAFPKEKMSRAIIMPYGGYFDTGLMQAAGYRYRMGSHKSKRVVLITYADLPENIDVLGCAYDSLHTFFGELKIEKGIYKKLNVKLDNDLFAAHADPIICQLPFLRSYYKIDEIIPVILNNKKTDLDHERFWSVVGGADTCYILCSNHVGESAYDLLQSYQSIFSEEFLLFGPEQQIS